MRTAPSQLVGKIGDLRARPISGRYRIYRLPVPPESVALCIGCRQAAGQQRQPGQPPPEGEEPINPHVAFDLVTGEEVDVPAAPPPAGGWFSDGERLG